MPDDDNVVPLRDSVDVHNRELHERLGSKPTIEVKDGELARMGKEAEAALVAAKAPVLTRAGMLVRPVIDMRRASDGSMIEVTVLRPLTDPTLSGLLSEHVAFLKRQAFGKAKVVNPPEKVVPYLLMKGNWKFPTISGVITSPTLRLDGTILDRPGYDLQTQLWYAPTEGFTMPPIVETKAAAKEALALLKNLVREFSFEGDRDRTVSLAGMMTPVLRGGCKVAPMIAFFAHMASSGKSYLTDMACTIVRGQPCPATAMSDKSEEFAKQLGAMILEGAQIISLDNCSVDIGGDMLCQITERQLLRIRILGKSEAPECEWWGVIFANGNNVSIIGDMTRRAIQGNLDPQMERPENHPYKFDPIAEIMKDRGKYVAAILTMARAYLASGEQVDCPPIASYGGWSRIVREPLIWLGESDVCGSMETARDMDPERTAARELVAQWLECFGVDHSYTAAEIIEKACASGDHESHRYPDLYRLMLTHCSSRGGGPDPGRLARWLARIKGQIHLGHFRIELARADAKQGYRYCLKDIEPRPLSAAEAEIVREMESLL